MRKFHEYLAAKSYRIISIAALIAIGSFILGVLSTYPGLRQIERGAQSVANAEAARLAERAQFSREYPVFFADAMKNNPVALRQLMLGKDPSSSRGSIAAGFADIAAGSLAARYPIFSLYPGIQDGTEIVKSGLSALKVEVSAKTGIPISELPK